MTWFCNCHRSSFIKVWLLKFVAYRIVSIDHRNHTSSFLFSLLLSVFHWCSLYCRLVIKRPPRFRIFYEFARQNVIVWNNLKIHNALFKIHFELKIYFILCFDLLYKLFCSRCSAHSGRELFVSVHVQRRAVLQLYREHGWRHNWPQPVWLSHD
jgi:hypothetical protein